MTNIKLPSMQDLLEAGVHFGHRVSRGNPKMQKYIFGARDGVHIVDLALTEECLKKATEYLYSLGLEGKTLLVIGTKKQTRPVVEELCKESKVPYINERWIGGLLTNFEELRRNIKKLIDLKTAKASGQLDHYTKKEQLLISRKLEKFERNFGGVADLEVIPNALLILDIASDKTAVREASRMSLPTVAVCDTNSDPTPITYPVPGNDDGIKAIRILSAALIEAYLSGRGKAASNEAKAKLKEEKASQDAKAKLEEISSEDIKEQIEAVEEAIEKAIVEESSAKE